MAKWENRRMRSLAEGSRYGDITESDLRYSCGYLLTLRRRNGDGYVLEVAGETMPQLGLLGLTVDRAGSPVGLFIIDRCEAVQIAQSNPKRVAEDDDGG